VDMDDGGYEALFRREYPAILRTAFAVVGDRRTAEEVTQEAFARLYVRWDKVSGYDRPGAWVRRVAIRVAVRRRVSRPLALEAAPASPALPLDDRIDLHAALRALSPMQRAAVVLHYLHDLPVAQVAAELGCRESTVRVHLHRARQHLAAVLSESEVPSGDR
jgi:RNA polymerase sigma factor (sigma-70 family)